MEEMKMAFKYRDTVQRNVGRSQAELDAQETKYEEFTQDDSPVTEADLKKIEKNKLKEAEEAKDAVAMVTVNLRLEPSMDGEVLCALFPDVKVKVNKIPGNNAWYALTYQGRNCFVRKEFIKIL